LVAEKYGSSSKPVRATSAAAGGAWEVLRERPLRVRQDRAVVGEDHGARRGGAGVEGEDGHGSAGVCATAPERASRSPQTSAD
jgi:hypothetical protein